MALAAGATRTRRGTDRRLWCLARRHQVQRPAGLREVLLKKQDMFVENFTERLLTYALGRGLEEPTTPPCARSRARRPWTIKWSAIILGIVKSTPFRMRRLAMVVFKYAIPRRTFLRGVGATLALPMLDAMTPALSAATTRPTRMAFMQTPNGIFNLKGEWTPKTVGANFELTRTLEPLAAFKDRMMVISGLDNQQAAGLTGEVGGDHPRACTAWLTGTHAKMTSGADLRAGISADQIAAKEFGKHTQLASLEIGMETPEVVGACESAYGCAYYNTISWRNETTPLPMENRPRAVFERLFGDAGPIRRRGWRIEKIAASSMRSTLKSEACV